MSRAAQTGLFNSEFDIANAVWVNSRPDVSVIACGFAFPTLDDFKSIPFSAVIGALRGPGSPRPGIAVVAPAGNEDTLHPYWPAATESVVGVASSEAGCNLRAPFSNWGTWCDCCADGDNVVSTYIDWSGPVAGYAPGVHEKFTGWARWSGTSFAAPKVAAAIACVVARSDGQLAPVEAWAQLVSGRTSVGVEPLTDTTLDPAGVTLPHILL
jgi:subtilisin family serine protease